jgi:ComF family protein
MYFDQARSPWLYDGMVRDLVCRLKYTGAVWLLQDFGHWLSACYETFFARVEPDWVTWVPLHWTRRVRRGFNQSSLLVDAMKSRQPGLKSVRLLKKTKNTPSQTRLTASQRLTNVKGSFQVLQPDRVSQSRILLIDDVMTTGSTVNEAARVLKEAGAEEIFILTLARGGS